MNSSAESYLELYLEPFATYLARDEVTDIYVNRPGEIWIETLGGRTERYDDPRVDEGLLWRLARQLAQRSNQGVSPAHPLLAASLPDGGRVQVVAPPATRAGMAVAIRRHVAAKVELASYGGGFPAQEPRPCESDLASCLERKDYAPLLAHAVRSRWNVLVSGGTSSGKTTLLNSLLAEIPASERLIFIEDTPELRISHRNSVGLVAVRGRLGEADLTSEDLLQAALRMRPDRIILGELRGPEAFTFLRAINTGHPGSLTTIHADSAERAFVQLAMMALQSGSAISYANVLALVRDMVDVVVQLHRVDGVRRISEMLVRPSTLAAAGAQVPLQAPAKGRGTRSR